MSKEKIELVLHPEIKKWRKEQLVNESLFKDIREKGQLQNLIARRLPNGKVELIAGYRRYIALKALGKKPEEMDIKILENISDRDAALTALAENTQRQDMSPVEEGRAFRTLMKLRMPVDEIAMRQGRSEAYVRNRLELLDLPDKIQELMDDRELEMSYAKPLNRLKDAGEHAQLLLVKGIMEGKQKYYGGIHSVEDANEFVDKALAKIKHQEELVKKYGPCPQCGSKDIGETWEKNKLVCGKCGYAWHKETKDPWEYYELKEKATELGLKLDIGEGEAKLTPEDVAEVMRRVEEAREKPLPKTLRSTHNVMELLTPFIRPENVYLFRVEGEKIEVKLIEDTRLRFTVRRHNYKTGEKTKVRPLSVWGDETNENAKRVKRFLESLELE